MTPLRRRIYAFALALFVVSGVASAAYIITHFPWITGGRSLLRIALEGCRVVREAAQIAREVDSVPSTCPSVAELVALHRLPPHYASDPWGTPYVVHCDGNDVRVVSAGKDLVEGTDDDIRDDFGPAEMARLQQVYARRAGDE